MSNRHETKLTGHETKLTGHETKLTGHDIESVAAKLEKFAAELPKQEQDVLGWIISRAQTAPEPQLAAKQIHPILDRAGYQSNLAAELARSVGLAAAGKPEVTVVVGWTYRFGGPKLPENPGDPVLHTTGPIKG